MTVLCQCGCGRPAPLAKKTRRDRGVVKGQPQRFIRGHATQDGKVVASIQPPNPTGLCMCGCGRRTSIVAVTDTQRGDVKGHHRRFVTGHAHRIDPESTYVVDEHGCWIWLGRLNTDGYGVFRADGRTQGAHRWFWERDNGPVPTGLVIDHLCRVPACVNPDHLEPVTNAENIRRGRATRLTAEQIADIRSSSGTHADVGAVFGITREHAWRIRTGRVWVVQ